ncbi:WD40 repeat-like protein [Myriangium duriaei CBS 260.36]|uniref:WD40 repeat-like protein n=1 Tax=Myriangium duriaei CBS 260.36 TaxID=1168546 RepID=A0A9P4J5Z6_9PEZI|nr:WD40 repeat-like protein [Myriangium duriaei CBS 260.36]
MPAADEPVPSPDTRLSKRTKLSANHALQKRPRRTPGVSKLFASFRTVGLVSPSTVPFTSIALGKTTFQITTSVGRSLQTYDLRRGLNLVFITRPQTPAAITATLAWKDCVFAAFGGSFPGIWIFKRGKKVGQLALPSGKPEDIKSLRIFGSWIVATGESTVLVWKAASRDFYTSIQCMPGSHFTGATAIVPTLLNKLLLGKDDGSVEIWNVATGKLVYTILPESVGVGAVTALEPAPALGLVAFGHSDGSVVIKDVCADETIMQFYAGSDTIGVSPITSIAFRTDGLGAGEDGRKPGVMATASLQSGDITMWDLNNGGRKSGVLRGAHAAPSKYSRGGVGKIEFLPGQAVLVSSGLDNHLNTWIFDETPFSPVPRPLHTRGGHGAAVSSLHFLPSASDGSDMSGKWLLASSRDRSLWGWSLRRDGQSSELSQGAVKKKARKSGIMSSEGRDYIEGLKAPPITAMACSLNRDGGMGALPGKLPIWQTPAQIKAQRGARDAEVSGTTGWESVVTAHEGDPRARTWFWGRKRAGRWALETSDNTEAKSVTISPCGTFAVVGSAGGAIDAFNLQSGMHRQRFPPRLTNNQAKQLKLKLAKDSEENIDLETESGRTHFYRGQGRHSAPVTGLAVDNLNHTLISADASGRVKFWSFASGALEHELDWSNIAGRINQLRLHRGSELVAFSCADAAIRVLDISTHKVVRELRISRSGSTGLSSTPFTDLAFSPDGRFLAAAVDQYVAVFDLPTGHLVDLFRLHSTCTALSFSPTGEYLATATTASVGVDIWTNRTLFTHVPTRHLDAIAVAAILDSTSLPTAPIPAGTTLSLLPSAEDSDNDSDTPPSDDDTDSLLASSLTTLSLLPRSRWQNLLYLDSVRARNRPTEPPKKPEKAPFFLPSTGGLAPSIAPAASQANDEPDLAVLEAERSRIMRMSSRGGESTALFRAAQHGKYDPLVAHMKSLSPAAADVAIRSLSVASSDGINECALFVAMLTSLLRGRSDFELGQAWMGVWLRVHADVVVADAETRERVREWQGALEEEKERIERLVGYVRGMTGYLGAGRV